MKRITTLGHVFAIGFWSLFAPWTLLLLLAFTACETAEEFGEMGGAYVAGVLMLAFAGAVCWTLGGILLKLKEATNA